MPRRLVSFFLIVLAALVLLGGAFLFFNEFILGPDLKRLSDDDIRQVKLILRKLGPFIEARERSGTLPTLTFAELEAPLDEKEMKFLGRFRRLRGWRLGVRTPYRGIARGSPDLVPLGAQWVKIRGRQVQLPPQFLPKKVHERYLEMMSAMERRIGKRLLVESGYRSSAYQLYLFLFYLKNHDYSIRETVKWVALPGYSEHGAPEHQAIDFISSDGVSGETDPSAFENLEEYRWLLENAGRFGFVLSYPKDRPGVTFEPWHWRCETRYNSGK